jgi:hypothetical protein
LHPVSSTTRDFETTLPKRPVILVSKDRSGM